MPTMKLSRRAVELLGKDQCIDIVRKALKRTEKSDDPYIVEVSVLAAASILYHLSAASVW